MRLLPCLAISAVRPPLREPVGDEIVIFPEQAEDGHGQLGQELIDRVVDHTP